MNMSRFKQSFLFVEMFVGFLAIIFGIVLSWLVRGTGYYPGALMLCITGALTLVLSFKEWKVPTLQAERFQVMNLLFTILRRAFFFLNLMLSSLVIGTIFQIIEY
jgi:hypothetical protein